MKIMLSALFIVLLALDQVTKLMIKSKFVLHESIPVIDGFFNITYVLNPGAAFGILANLPETYRRGFFIIITIIAIAAIVYLMVKESHLKLRAVSYTLILSGAVGNFIDRAYMGKVVDFLDVYIKNHHWPAFNVADSAISIGVFLLILDMLFFNKETKQEHPSTNE